MKHYTDEENTLILISLLKSHGIKRIIASPGTTNISFVASLQCDSFFEVFSAIDERAAAYLACGLAEETGEPVVLSCTGATASRNYIPGLTEAFYRQLPVLAVTSSQHYGRIGSYRAQVIDRTIQFPDLVKCSYQLYTIGSSEDQQSAITMVNEALLELTHGHWGPVHINLYTTYSNGFNTCKLPKYRVIRRIKNEGFPLVPKGKNAVWIGSHGTFSDEETRAIERFCETNNAIVLCDHISNYRGKYRFLASLVNNQPKDLGTRRFDLVIYIGYIHGTYLNFSGKQLWRVNPDGVIRDPFYTCTFVFEMEELQFFDFYGNGEYGNEIFNVCKQATLKVSESIPVIPFSNLWIAQVTAGLLPKHSVLHLGILNSLRAWNYFEIPESVMGYANSGGYGIDGDMSSFWGSALTNPTVEHYLVIGDLAFFYDINVVANSMPKNIHIMLINNGIGTEFKNYNHRATIFGDDANLFMAAKGHNGNKSCSLVKLLCSNVKMEYLCAKSKEEYIEVRDIWLSPNTSPVLLEVFTSDVDESNALRAINSIIQDRSLRAKISKTVVWRLARKVFRGR